MAKINFMKFKKILNDNDILLFDSNYRIAHNRLNNLEKMKNNEQHGGSNFKLSKLNKNILNRLVDSLLSSNTDRTNWIISNY
jgi:hypothetical protein